MSEHDQFEHELAVAMRAYVAEAPTQIDASAFVGALVANRPHRRFVGIELFEGGYRWVALLAVLAALLIAVLAVGTGGRPALFGDASPSASPTAARESPTATRESNEMIAFIRSGDLWVLRADEREPVMVVDGRALGGQFLANTRFLIWSPDGSTLAIASGGAIMLFEAATLTARDIADDAPPRQVWGWTPDSRALLTRPGGEGGTFDLWATDVGSGVSRHLSSDRVCQAVFSPDGAWIAATANSVVVVAAAGNFQWAVIGANSGYGCGPFTGWDGPTWSADSNRVAFISGFDGGLGGTPPFEAPSRTTITVAARDGTGSYQLTDQAAAWALPKWSPDGAWIAYRSSDGLRLIRPDGTGSQLIFEGVVDRGRISWASDSTRIDFGVTPGDDPYGPTELWSYDLSTGGAEPIGVGGLVDDFARRP